MNIPKDYPKSKDVIDRSHGEKPTLTDQVRDLAIDVRNDWQEMKEIERRKEARNTVRRTSRR